MHCHFTCVRNKKCNCYGHTDVSSTALDCAKENTMLLNAHVQFIEHDILNEELTEKFDLIVSNPPYISIEEKNSMKPNVLEYEPHLALLLTMIR